MIDVLGPVTAAAHGGCVECDPNDDRGDDLYVFVLGGYKMRLCRGHVAMLRAGLARAENASMELAAVEIEIEQLTNEIGTLVGAMTTRTHETIARLRAHRAKWARR